MVAVAATEVLKMLVLVVRVEDQVDFRAPAGVAAAVQEAAEHRRLAVRAAAAAAALDHPAELAPRTKAETAETMVVVVVVAAFGAVAADKVTMMAASVAEVVLVWQTARSQARG